MESTVYIVLLTLFTSSLVRSTLGFGDALVAMPMLTLVVSLKVATPLVALLSCSMAIVILLQDYKSIDFKSTWKLSIGALVGVPIGAMMLTQLSDGIVKGLLGLLVFAFCMFRLAGPQLGQLKDDRFAPTFGFVSGVFGGAYNTFGPPIVIFGAMRRWNAETYRVSIQGFYLPVCIMVLTVHSLSGFWTPEVFRYFAAALPIVLLATFIGRILNRRIGRHGNFDRIIYVVLTIVSFVLMYGAFSELSGA